MKQILQHLKTGQMELAELPVFDLRRVFENNSEQLYIDDCHLNGEGYRLVAESVGRYIVAEGLIPDSPSVPLL